MPPKRIALTCERCSAIFLGAPYARKPGAPPQRFCSRACRYEGPITDLAVRFWAGVDRSSSDGCWPWQRARRNSQGHGGVWDGKRWTHAHRVAYALTNGPIPDGMEVCHRCDNPPCCRPDHLFLGTHAENMDDMKAKRRNGRVSADIEARALALLAAGSSQRETAASLGLTKSTIARIARRC